MMKKIAFLFLFSCVQFITNAQTVYSTKTGKAWFDAGTGFEDITATNKSVISAFDGTSGKIQFKISIKAFEFATALMGDHFNENYMESDKYPDAKFNGLVTNLDKINLSKDGTYPAVVKGKLTIHGVENEVEAKGNFTVSGQTIEANSEFVINMADYKIAIPSVVKDKLSKTAKIKINCNYSPVKK